MWSLPCSCTAGYSGVLCGVCQLGYHNSGAACDACAAGSSYALPVAIVVVVVALAGAVYIAKRVDTIRLVGAGKVIVSYLQIMGSSSSNYKIPWPAFMQGLLNSFRMALMDAVQIMAVDCYAAFDFFVPYYLVTMTTMCILVVAAITHASIPWVLRVAFPHLDPLTRQPWRSLIVKTVCVFMVRVDVHDCQMYVVIRQISHSG